MGFNLRTSGVGNDQQGYHDCPRVSEEKALKTGLDRPAKSEKQGNRGEVIKQR